MTTHLAPASAAIAVVLALAPAMSASPTKAAPASGFASPEQRERYREVTIPAGTVLAISLDTPVASDTSSIEDIVGGRLRRGVRIGGVEALPAGASLAGVVTQAARSGKVKGRARIAMRFNRVRGADGTSYTLRTSSIVRQARGTKKKDATKIGIGAGVGAVVGGITGGGKGAAIGSAIGGGAGTGAVLATRGEEVRLPAGTPLTVRLARPLTVQVRIPNS